MAARSLDGEARDSACVSFASDAVCSASKMEIIEALTAVSDTPGEKGCATVGLIFNEERNRERPGRSGPAIPISPLSQAEAREIHPPPSKTCFARMIWLGAAAPSAGFKLTTIMHQSRALSR